MTENEITVILALLAASVLCIVIPALVGIIVKLTPWGKSKKPSSFSKMLITISGVLIASIWCTRFAVGYHQIVTANAGEATLNTFEEIFNSVARALQTFSMDEDYTQYILDGKAMMRSLGANGFWVAAFGVYSSLLNFVAPIAGGAAIFEILASVFPKMRLQIALWMKWKHRIYFSELNERSLALAKSICAVYNAEKNPLKRAFVRPVLIFADTYVDDEDEKSSERALDARLIGAICIRDDIVHISKSTSGCRKNSGRNMFCLMKENDVANLQAFSGMSEGNEIKYLKNSEVFIFTRDDIYVDFEKSFTENIKNNGKIKESEYPTVTPINDLQNLVWNHFARVPLYEPLVGRDDGEGERELNFTVLGSGRIGMQSVLTAYWMGQMLDVRLKIRVVSEEPKSSFFDRLDFISPEIIKSTFENDSILLYNDKDHSLPYCTIEFFEANAGTDQLFEVMSHESGFPIERSDYIVASLGSDEKNIAVASKLRTRIGSYHIEHAPDRRTVISYVVYDHDLCQVLNRIKHYRNVSPDRADVYMCAMGSIQERFGVGNVFIVNDDDASDINAMYNTVRYGKATRDANAKKMRTNFYSRRSSKANSLHAGYRVFSMGFMEKSVFDYVDVSGEEAEERRYEDLKAAYGRYNAFISDKKSNLAELHRLSWLEHRRWCAFMRSSGFRNTANYQKYKELLGDYKNLSLYLHPCLVECDEKGMRVGTDENGEFLTDENGSILSDPMLGINPEGYDLLDRLTYDVHSLGYKGSYDFKTYDYPSEAKLKRNMI